MFVEKVEKLSPTQKVQFYQKLIKSNSQFKELFKLAYDKNVVFNVRFTKKEIKDLVKQARDRELNFEKILKAIKYIKNIKQRSKKQYIKRLTTKLSKDEMFIFLSVINKDFGIGYKQVCKILNGELPYFPFQLAKKFELKELKSKKVIIQPKLDGIRIIYNPVKQEFYTRNHEILTIDKYPNLRWIKKQFEALIELYPELQNYVFDGEMFAENWDLTMHIVSTEDKLPDEEVIKLKFYIFDIINRKNFENYKFTDIVDRSPFYKRLKMLNKIPKIRLIEVVDSFLLSNFQSEHLNEILNHYLKKGYEGVMIKQLKEPYYEGRKNAWLKLKPQNELEAVIIDVIEGDGKYQGRLGAFVCKSKIKSKEVVFKVGSGMTDEQRLQFWLQREKLIGKIIDVKYQELTKDLVPRFPTFVRLRIDKNEPNFE